MSHENVLNYSGMNFAPDASPGGATTDREKNDPAEILRRLKGVAYILRQIDSPGERPPGVHDQDWADVTKRARADTLSSVLPPPFE